MPISKFSKLGADSIGSSFGSVKITERVSESRTGHSVSEERVIDRETFHVLPSPNQLENPMVRALSDVGSEPKGTDV